MVGLVRWVAAVGPLLFALGCGHEPVEAGVFFPTWDAGGAVPDAIVAGRLIERSDCLFIDADGMQALVLWEDGMGYDGGELLDPGGDPIARVGSSIHGGGGWFSDRKHAEDLAGERIPDRCVLDGPDRFAMIYDVEPGPSS
jgi:hypothetical protein